MDNNFRRPLIALVILLWFTTAGCQKAFEYSPYSSDLPSGYDQMTTEKNRSKLLASEKTEGSSFKVAVLADTHYFLEDLRKAVRHINDRTDIDFTIIAGDLCDQGLNKEFLFLYDELVKLETPVFTVIGNHDYLANAELIYAKMFGSYNYVLDYRGFRFIFFDAVFWEKNGTPDFKWLEEQLLLIPESHTPVLVSHIPPFGDQYDHQSEETHLDIVRKHRLPLSIHGHVHEYSYTQKYEDGTNYLVAPSAEKGVLCILSFENGDYQLSVENY